MVWGIRCHWKKESTPAEELWRCWHPGCKMTDQTSHISRCSGYLDLQDDLMLSNEKDLVTFVKRVIQRRSEELEK